MNRIKTTSVISIAGLLCAGLLTSAVQAANAPEWLGGKLTKPRLTNQQNQLHCPPKKLAGRMKSGASFYRERP